MKNFSFFITLFLLFFILPLAAYAHPGKTDSSGGHYNHSTGEYHYHHGYEAHSHYDMDGNGSIDCPYDFHDRTSHDNSVNSSVSFPDSLINTTIPLQKKEMVDSQVGEERHSTEYAEKEKGMFAEIIGTVFIFLSFLFVAIPVGFFAIMLLGSGCMIVIYPISSLLIRKDSGKAETVALVLSAVIAISLLLYWFLPDFADYLMESEVNIIVFIFFILIFIGVLVYINYASDRDNEEILKGKDEAIDELRKKNQEYSAIIKDMSNFCEQLQAKLNKETEQTEYQKKIEDSKLELAYKDIDRFRREVQQAKNDRYTLAREKADLMQEMQNLKQLLHFYETGHTVLRPKIDNLPDDVYFVDGLPIAGKVTEYEPFGRFTVYASKKGSRFHADEFCGGNILYPIHLFEAITHKQRCIKCGSSLPSQFPDWYITFKKIK